jgi:DNA-binding response OmpR family regulator
MRENQLACLLLSRPIVRILIIDDDKLLRWVLREICVREGHDVSAVADAESALREVESGSCDIIFADLETESIDAGAIAGKLSALQPKASLVLLSARPRQEIESLLGGFAISGIIEKPFDASDVRSFISNIQDRKRGPETTAL